MKKITISQRIIILSGVLMATIGFLTFSSYSSLNDILIKYNKIIDQNFYKQEIAQEMFIQAKEARVNALFSATQGVPEEMKKEAIQNVDKSVEEMTELISSYEMVPMEDEEKKIFQNVNENWNSYLAILNKIKNYHLENRNDPSLLTKIVHDECPKMAENLKNSFEELNLYHGSSIIKYKKEIQDFSADKNQFIFILGISSVVFGLIVSIFISFSTKKLLALIVERVSNVTNKLNSESDNLSSSSQQLASAAQQQASSTEEISSSLEEISGMVGSTIKQASDSVKLSQEITKLVTQGNEAVDVLDKSVLEIAEANKKVEKLVYLIEEIGQKTEIIDEIVFQTRLLSFNASVEAERAGEHGRGFAVVAQEVGNLAQMSGKSANEISEIVKRSIREAQEVVALNKSKVNSGVESSKQASEKLKAIYGVTRDINEAVNEVLKASEEQNSGIKQINNSIQLISHSTQENATMAEEFFSGSKQLTDQSKMLSSSVSDLIEFVFGKSHENKSSPLVEKNQVLKFPTKKEENRNIFTKQKKAVGENFHQEDEDHWDKL
jgi:methyl-accepting chemotaxis protein